MMGLEVVGLLEVDVAVVLVTLHQQQWAELLGHGAVEASAPHHQLLGVHQGMERGLLVVVPWVVALGRPQQQERWGKDPWEAVVAELSLHQRVQG